MNSKKAQITIFIIVALVIVAGVALFFLMKTGVVPNPLGRKVEVNSNVFLEQCLEDEIQETLEVLMAQGGYISNPLSVNFEFEDEKPVNISYLCYTESDYVPCVNQEPMFLKHLKEYLK